MRRNAIILSLIGTAALTVNALRDAAPATPVEPADDREPVTGKRQFAETRQQRRARERAERKASKHV